MDLTKVHRHSEITLQYQVEIIEGLIIAIIDTKMALLDLIGLIINIKHSNSRGSHLHNKLVHFRMFNFRIQMCKEIKLSTQILLMLTSIRHRISLNISHHLRETSIKITYKQAILVTPTSKDVTQEAQIEAIELKTKLTKI